eukprot:366074-Chlamydomonas_euryale.AAC.9
MPGRPVCRRRQEERILLRQVLVLRADVLPPSRLNALLKTARRRASSSRSTRPTTGLASEMPRCALGRQSEAEARDAAGMRSLLNLQKGCWSVMAPRWEGLAARREQRGPPYKFLDGTNQPPDMMTGKNGRTGKHAVALPDSVCETCRPHQVGGVTNEMIRSWKLLQQLQVRLQL